MSREQDLGVYRFFIAAAGFAWPLEPYGYSRLRHRFETPTDVAAEKP